MTLDLILDSRENVTIYHHCDALSDIVWKYSEDCSDEWKGIDTSNIHLRYWRINFDWQWNIVFWFLRS